MNIIVEKEEDVKTLAMVLCERSRHVKVFDSSSDRQRYIVGDQKGRLSVGKETSDLTLDFVDDKEDKLPICFQISVAKDDKNDDDTNSIKKLDFNLLENLNVNELEGIEEMLQEFLKKRYTRLMNQSIAYNMIEGNMSDDDKSEMKRNSDIISQIEKILARIMDIAIIKGYVKKPKARETKEEYEDGWEADD